MLLLLHPNSKTYFNPSKDTRSLSLHATAAAGAAVCTFAIQYADIPDIVWVIRMNLISQSSLLSLRSASFNIVSVSYRPSHRPVLDCWQYLFLHTASNQKLDSGDEAISLQGPINREACQASNGNFTLLEQFQTLHGVYKPLNCTWTSIHRIWSCFCSHYHNIG